MHIIIHRGTNQIGGCITEIRTSTTRIFIDMGSELEPEEGMSEKIELDGVTQGAKNCDAVFFTHSHGDHVGRLTDVLPDVPLYMGEASKELMLVLQERLKHNKNINNEKLIARLKTAHTFTAPTPVKIGDIKVTPIFVDHSAYDAYMFLIEADGKKVLHTGDFRTHGFKGKGVLQALEKYARQVDILITEGTMLSRDEYVMSEKELQQEAEQYLKNYKYVYVLCSSMNIDRLAAFHSSLPKEKYMVCDEYQKKVFEIVNRHTEEYKKRKNIKDRTLYEFKKICTYKDDRLEKMKQNGFCMPVRANKYFKNLMAQFDKQDSILLYSMWKGYLKKDENIENFIKDYKWEYLHTSGHATKETLEKVCNTVKPKIGIIPIHTDNAKHMDSLNISSKIIYLKDKEEFEVH